MNQIALIAPALLLAAGLAIAQKPVATNEQDHQAHHPDGAASAPPAPKPAVKSAPQPAPKAASEATVPRPAKDGDMGARMKAMQDMHQKMRDARTAEERQALMAEHMKAMQDGMGMMKQMAGKTAGAGPGMKGQPTDPKARMDALEQRMDMMQMMMDMMLDRMSSAPASTGH